MQAADAEDVLQETFLAVHRALGQFRGEAPVSTWVYRIALRAADRASTLCSNGHSDDHSESTQLEPRALFITDASDADTDSVSAKWIQVPRGPS